MQYMLFCCIEEKKWAALPEAERGRIMDEYGSLMQELKANGRLLSGAKLDSPASAVTVRKKNGNPVFVDGPFAETREQVGGYHVVECKNREEAVAIALRIPSMAAGGVVEVRPIQWME